MPLVSVRAVMMVFVTAAREGGPVVVGTSTGGTEVLVQSQEEYKASSYLREIEAEIQHQRQLALALGGVCPLQPVEDGPAYQRWATPGVTFAVPRIPRQQRDGEESTSPPAPTTAFPAAKEGPSDGGSPGVEDEERELLEKPEAEVETGEVTPMGVEISAEKQASLLAESGSSYLNVSRAAERELPGLVDLVAPPLGRVAPVGESAPIAFVETPTPAADASNKTMEGQEWDAPTGLSPIILVTPPKESAGAPPRRGRRNRRR